jgi:flagellar biosynthesis/type III secretory pathway protein FliH
VPLHRPLRELRLRTLPAPGQAATDPRAAWLLGLPDVAAREARREAELAATLAALRAELARVPAQIEANLAQAAGLATEIGLAVAEEVLCAALDRGTIDLTPTVRRCLEEATVGLTDAQIELRLHPEDLSHVMAELGRDPALREQIARARFIPDLSMPRAAVRIDTGAGRLRYDQREVLARIAREVRAAVAGAELHAVARPPARADGDGHR